MTSPACQIPAQLRLVDERDAVLARRFAGPLRAAEAVVGLALTVLSERGVDLAADLLAAGWTLGPDGRWRLPGHKGGRSLVEALGAECGRRLRTDGAWWAAFGPRTVERYDLRFGEHVAAVSATVAPEVAAGLLRMLDSARAARPEWGPASEARRKLEAVARKGLPPRAVPAAPSVGLEVAPAYLRANGTAAE